MYKVDVTVKVALAPATEDVLVKIPDGEAIEEAPPVVSGADPGAPPVESDMGMPLPVGPAETEIVFEKPVAPAVLELAPPEVAETEEEGKPVLLEGRLYGML